MASAYSPKYTNNLYNPTTTTTTTTKITQSKNDISLKKIYGWENGI